MKRFALLFLALPAALAAQQPNLSAIADTVFARWDSTHTPPPIPLRPLLPPPSGLREWSSLVAAQGWPRGPRAHPQAELLDVVFRQKALNYPVGDYYSYTNS